MAFHAPEVYRVHTGNYASVAEYGNNGAFQRPGLISGRNFVIIASDGQDWEHVSVHMQSGKKLYTPNWEEMCLVKGLFWDPEDTVIQYHPPQSTYRNYHPHTLHLWRPIGITLPLPDPELVGPVGERTT